MSFDAKSVGCWGIRASPCYNPLEVSDDILGSPLFRQQRVILADASAPCRIGYHPLPVIQPMSQHQPLARHAQELLAMAIMT